VLGSFLKFFGEFAGQEVIEHHEVCLEGPHWISEGGRNILFKNEMPDPCKGVSRDETDKNQIPRLMSGEDIDRADHANSRADKMKDSTSAILVLRKVEGPKLFKRLDRRMSFFHTQSFKPDVL